MMHIHAMPGKSRVIKMKGHGKGRIGKVEEVNFQSNQILVRFEDTLLAHWCNPHEFEHVRKTEGKEGVD